LVVVEEEMVVLVLLAVLAVLAVQVVDIVPLPELLVLPHNHLNHNLEEQQTMEMLEDRVLQDVQVGMVVAVAVAQEHLEHRIQEDLLVE
jgi:hypothetical protein